MTLDWAAFDVLSKRLGQEWSNIRACRDRSQELLKRLGESETLRKACPADTGLVIFGSLARGEYTEGSDVDWTLLIDGQANQEHSQAPHGIRRELEELNLAKPNPAGAFGALSFSHDLVHRVGGDLDTNRNTTQRVLLLLESCAPHAPEVRKRVMRQVLSRYFGEDRENLSQDARVPRFLLNDIVRFWRTMAVDFPAKQRDRDGEGWAIRNLKLRLSRKLIFASGLFACLDVYVRPSDQHGGHGLLEQVVETMELAPLEVLAKAALDYRASADVVENLFSAYDAFLGILNDADKREQLKHLNQAAAADDPVFHEGKEAAKAFQSGLTGLFFNTNADLTSACQRYGVF